MKGQSQHEQLGHLRQLNKRSKLGLFVGAGISFGCGLPSWDELIEGIAKRALPSITPEARSAVAHLNSIVRTRLFKSRLKDRFNIAVADALYAKPYSLSKAVHSIAASGIRRICNYNFDDVLEEGFRIEGVEFNSLEAGWALNNNFYGTIIFHPHGVLTPSMNAKEAAETRLVLSEEDYHELYSNPYSWANLVQLSLLMSHTCLFVGVSLHDPNLRRLMDVCASLNITHQHYAIVRSPSYAVAADQKRLTRQIKLAIAADLRSLHVEPIWVRRFEDIPGIFKTIKVKRDKKS